MGHNLPDYKASADLPLMWGRRGSKTPGPDLHRLKKKKKMQIQTKQPAEIGTLGLPPFYYSSGSSTAKMNKGWPRRLLRSRESTIKKVRCVFSQGCFRRVLLPLFAPLWLQWWSIDWFSHRLNQTGTIIERRIWNYIHKNIHYTYPSGTT